MKLELEALSKEYLRVADSPLVRLIHCLLYYPGHFRPELAQAVAGPPVERESKVRAAPGLVRPMADLLPDLTALLGRLRDSEFWACGHRCRWYRDDLARLLFTTADAAQWDRWRAEEAAVRAGQVERSGPNVREQKKNQLDNLARRARAGQRALAQRRDEHLGGDR